MAKAQKHAEIHPPQPARRKKPAAGTPTPVPEPVKPPPPPAPPAEVPKRKRYHIKGREIVYRDDGWFYLDNGQKVT